MSDRKITGYMIKGAEKAFLLTVLIIGYLPVFMPFPGCAETSGYDNRAPHADPRKVYHGSNCGLLKTPVELPDLPKYTSRAYFLGGYDYPPDYMVHSRNVQLKFAVHEPKEQVLDWYRDALMSYAWTVTQPKQANSELMANKGKNFCFVTVTDAKGPWFSSIITLDYKLGQ
jgi:hypothetical protein